MSGLYRRQVERYADEPSLYPGQSKLFAPFFSRRRENTWACSIFEIDRVGYRHRSWVVAWICGRLQYFRFRLEVLDLRRQARKRR